MILTAAFAAFIAEWFALTILLYFFFGQSFRIF